LMATSVFHRKQCICFEAVRVGWEASAIGQNPHYTQGRRNNTLSSV
jgi:hypothetical protein